MFDHNVIEVSIYKKKTPTSLQQTGFTTKPKMSQLNYAEANWAAINTSIDWNCLLSLEHNTETMMENFLKKIEDICTNNTPIKSEWPKRKQKIPRKLRIHFRKRRNRLKKLNTAKHITRTRKLLKDIQKIERKLEAQFRTSLISKEINAINNIKKDSWHFYKHLKKFTDNL